GDPSLSGSWQEEASKSGAIINLAGASIFSRWNKTVKQKILESRVSITRNLVEAMAASRKRPQVLLNASAVGYYGFRGDEEIDETGSAGDDFLARVCQVWEAEALKARDAGARVALTRFGIVLNLALTRFGIVLNQRGGALKQMLPLFRAGLGGRLGKGNQWFSWIHLTDLVRAITFVLDRTEADGPINLTAPNPVTNAEMTRALSQTLHRPAILPVPGSQTLHRPAILPVPGFMMRLVLGEFGSVLLKGQRQTLGFNFQFPLIKQALADLLT
ncbi:MAG: DUF1731 domain-containing protein, partial [Deltaproteobacteria bacterium]|nr:DUF1731 domain-containing protein [Deltaproteobacteria bacterium]